MRTCPSFRTLTGEVIIQIAEFPTDEIMDDLSLETPSTCSACSRARHRQALEPGHQRGPNQVTLYRRAILDYWAENEETLGSIINRC